MLAYLTFLLAATASGEAVKTVAQEKAQPVTRTVLEKPPPLPSKSKSATPRNNPGSWASNDDYPALGLMNNWEGTTGFILEISKDGRVSNCTISQTSGYTQLDAVTCMNIKRRGRFSPALDNVGNPTLGHYMNRVRWILPYKDIEVAPAKASATNGLNGQSPGGANKAPDPINMQNWLAFEPFAGKWGMMPPAPFRLSVDANGRPKSCSGVKSENKQYSSELCKALMKRASFDPARDSNGLRSKGTFKGTTELLMTMPPVSTSVTK